MSAREDGTVFVLRDSASPTGELWKVEFQGRIYPADWSRSGPAQAQLDLLRSGYSKMPGDR